jgi:predicted dehydrogenase
MNQTGKDQVKPSQCGPACDVSRRDFLKTGVVAGAVSAGSLGAFYFGYEAAMPNPLRVGVIGTGDEGSVLMGAVNPEFIQVVSIADIRPYNIHRAFHGDHSGDSALAVRCGLLTKYGWKTEDEARRHVKVYEGESGDYRNLIEAAKQDGVEAIVMALPLHLHAPAAIAAMRAGLHVLTEKLMGYSVANCKEMARVAHETGLHLATGHQRHYNILYAEAVDKIRRGELGDLHYIRAQWHRGNLPGSDSWQQPLPKDEKLTKELESWEKKLAGARGLEIDEWQKKVAQKRAQVADAVLDDKATTFGYEGKTIPGGDLYEDYKRSALEELIRWRLWSRTGGGLMVELGSHQLDAASIFIAASHGGEKQHPLNVAAIANRPIFPNDREVEDHVACMFEFPAPGYDPKDPALSRKKIGVQYASINGNGFGGYGEIVFGTKGTLILEREQEMKLPEGASSVKASGGGGPTMDTQASGEVAAMTSAGPANVSRGYAEELEHWAWCVRNPAPENKPRCHPKVALGDAVIALTTNIAAALGRRVDFKEAWFDPDSDEVPETLLDPKAAKPDLSQYT